MNLWRLLLCLLIAASLGIAAEESSLRFDQLDLTDGRKLKNVVVRSYDSATKKLLIVADGKAMTVPIVLVPPPLNEQLKAAPTSGTTTNVITITAPPAQPTKPMVPYIVAVPTAAPPISSASQPGMATVDPSAAEAAAHRVIALKRADQFYRYELQIASNNVQVTGLDFEIIDVNPIAGWTGRYRTEAKAFVSYYDSAGGSFKRFTSIFEVVTEQKLKEPIKVVDFTRKS
jgi:hypothetical protein